MSSNPILIQIGLNTHSHDHVITLHSLRTINTIANRPEKPIPLADADALLLLIVSYFISVFDCFDKVLLRFAEGLYYIPKVVWPVEAFDDMVVAPHAGAADRDAPVHGFLDNA